MLTVEIKINGRVIHYFEAKNIASLERISSGLSLMSDKAKYACSWKQFYLNHDRVDGALILARDLINEGLKK